MTKLLSQLRSDILRINYVHGHVVIDRGNHTGNGPEWRYEGQDSEELVQRPSLKILLAGEQAVYQERF